MLKRFLVVVALIAAVSCGKGNPNDPDDDDSSDGRSVTLNGSTFALSVVGGPTFTANVIQVALYPSLNGVPEYMAMTVGSSAGAGFAFFVPTAINPYSVTASVLQSAVYSETTGAGSASWEAKPGLAGSSGTIEVTGRTATTVSGKFSVTAVATTGASSGSKTITGSFTAKVA